MDEDERQVKMGVIGRVSSNGWTRMNVVLGWNKSEI